MKATYLGMTFYSTMPVLLLLSLIAVFSSACMESSGYEAMMEQELASGEKHDSLFLGLYFGMTSKEFYTHCWELNKMGLIHQGSRNTTVAYDPGEQLPHEAMMDFYPEFHEDRIVEMPVTVQYKAWSPWNRNLWADSLQLDMVHLLEEWYGDGFLEVKHPEKGTAFVKMDGNRRVVVTAMDDKYVRVLYTDMSVDRPEPEHNRDNAQEEETD